MSKKKGPINKSLVAVYGTLKAGLSNHRYLTDCPLKGYAYAPSEYCLVTLGAFPGAILKQKDITSHSNAHAPLVQVYEVPEPVLLAMDVLEGHPTFYERKKIDTPYGRAWLYTLPPKVYDTREVLPEGIWMETAGERVFKNSGAYSSADLLTVKQS